MNADRDDALLEVLRGAGPARVPRRLLAWSVARASEPPPAGVAPLEAAFSEHAEALFRYLCGLLDHDAWEAEQLLVRSFRALPEDGAAARTWERLLQRARHLALERLAKTGGLSDSPLPPAERALLYERRLGSSLEELARGWGTRLAPIEARLRSAAELLHAEVVAETGAACAVRHEEHRDAALDLLDEPAAEEHAQHRVGCSACGAVMDRLEERMTPPETILPAPDKTLARLEQSDPPIDPATLGIRVGVRCAYCHDGLRRDGASFCAACLAPHHPDCFGAHGGCSTPGCPGTDVVSPEVGTRRRRLRWGTTLGLGLGAVVTTAALSAGLTAAIDAWPRAGEDRAAGPRADAPVAPGPAEPPPSSAAPEPRPIPAGLKPGVDRTTVGATLGRPSSTAEHRGITTLSYRGQGVRVRLDARDRLVQASFFGARSDGRPREGPARTRGGGGGARANAAGAVHPGWRFHQQLVGAPLAPEAQAEVTRTHVDVSGAQFLAVGEHYVLEVEAERPYVVRAVHLAPGVTPDANGNLTPGRFRLHRRLSGADALARAIEAARAEGALESALGRRRHLGFEEDGLRELAEAEVLRAEDGAGLRLRLESWGLDRDGAIDEWQLLEERIDGEGRLLETIRSSAEYGPSSHGEVTTNWDTVEGVLSGPDRFRVRYRSGAAPPAVTKKEESSRQQLLSSTPRGEASRRRGTSLLGPWLLLPRLFGVVDMRDWEIELRQPVLGSDVRLPAAESGPSEWRGQPVEELWGVALIATEGPSAGDVVGLEELSPLGARSDWLEPADPAAWTELTQGREALGEVPAPGEVPPWAVREAFAEPDPDADERR